MKPLLDLEPNECRYAMNNGGPYLFCAEAKQEKSSYCPAHHEICLKPLHAGTGREAPHSSQRTRRTFVPAVMVLMGLSEDGAA